MGLDTQLKRFFPLLICALIALAAFFQASGIGRMVATSVAGDGAPSKPRARLMPPLTKAKVEAIPILARNAFDSVTGPLDGKAISVPDAPKVEAVPSEPGELSEDAPKCDFGRVVLISAFDNPGQSFAAIEDGGGGATLRRQGDPVAGHTVQAMSWNRVWLDKAGKQCQLKLGDRSKKAAVKKSTKRSTKRRRRRRGRQIPAAMAAKIHKVSATEFNVERSVVDEILENQAELMRSARIVPEKRGDKVLGIRLFGIRKGTLLNHLGFKNGDRLEAINGFEMANPQKALEAYGRLRTADALKVRLNRKGAPVNIDFNIQ